jgi:hypothetical protein
MVMQITAASCLGGVRRAKSETAKAETGILMGLEADYMKKLPPLASMLR